MEYYNELLTEYNEQLIRLQMLRDDLTGEIVIPEIEKLSAASTTSATDHLRACVRLAMKSQPMPWEKQTNRQRLISALRERLDIDESLSSDYEILEFTKNTFTRKIVELDLVVEDFGKAVRDSMWSADDFKKVVKKIRRLGK